MKTLGMLSALVASACVAVKEPVSGVDCRIGFDDEDYAGGGYLDVGTLEMGAPAFPFRPQVRAPMRAPAPGRRMPVPAAVLRGFPQQGLPRQYLYPQNPGAPQQGLKIQPLGLGQVLFTATSGTQLTLTAQPQRAFKAKRIIIALARTGATATGLVTVNSVNVGVDNQLAGSGPLPADAFAATAFDANIEFAPATPGINITAQLAISAAPTMTDNVACSGVMFGVSYG